MRTAAMTAMIWAMALGIGQAAESGPIATAKAMPDLPLTAAAAAPAAAPAPTFSASISAEPMDRATVQAETNAQIDAYLNRPAEVAEAPPADSLQPAGPRQMHGEVGASIGTGGYRSGYGMVNMPFGEANNLGVAVQSTRFASRRGFGGGTSTSVAVNLQLNSPIFGSSAPECIKRTGQRLVSDDKVDAQCAKLKDKDAAAR